MTYEATYLNKPAGQLLLEAKQISDTHYEISVPYMKNGKSEVKTFKKPLGKTFDQFYLTEGRGHINDRFTFRLSNTAHNIGEKLGGETIVDSSLISNIAPLSK